MASRHTSRSGFVREVCDADNGVWIPVQVAVALLGDQPHVVEAHIVALVVESGEQLTSVLVDDSVASLRTIVLPGFAQAQLNRGLGGWLNGGHGGRRGGRILGFSDRRKTGAQPPRVRAVAGARSGFGFFVIVAVDYAVLFAS